MDAQILIFVVLAAVGLSSAVMVVTRRNPVHSALYLVVTFFCVAAVFVVLHAEFLAAVQLLVYAGGIMVLFLFVILLVDVPGAAALRRPRRAHVITSAGLVALVTGLIGYHALSGSPGRGADTAVLGAQGGNLETVAITLFRYYVLPFEVVSILLLVALVGAIFLARSRA